ncbi:DUF6283 family protein [Streptomyces syringium]|uniref:DUF6283 family protein n=1 Tax=Streptomyces syringium TaxID=76729 RepID=UPI003D92F360
MERDTDMQGSGPAQRQAMKRHIAKIQPGVESDHRERPCLSCPWRTDTDLTTFSDDEMDMLRRANGKPAAEAPLDAPTVACHRDQPGTPREWRLCAGWLATVGEHHLGIRLAMAFGNLPVSAIRLGPGWPSLHAGLDALLAARAAQLGAPAGDTSG